MKIETIVFLHSYFMPDEIGGAELSVRAFAENMAPYADVTVITTLQSEAPIIESRDGYRIIRRQPWNIYSPIRGSQTGVFKKITWHLINVFVPNLSILLSIYKLRPKYLVVHAPTSIGFSTIFLATFLAKRRFTYLHDFAYMCVNQKCMRNDNPCNKRCAQCIPQRLLSRLISKRLAGVISNSKFLIDQFHSGNVFNKLPWAICYSPVQIQANSLAEKIPPKQRTFHIGYIGRISPEKGIEIFAGALKLIDLKSTPITVSIVGTGDHSYVNALSNVFPTNLVIDFLGKQNPWRVLSEIDLLVVPSAWPEPLGRVVIEAFLAKVPVIAADHGGLKELIANNRGIGFKPLEINALALSIQEVIAGRLPDLDAAHAFALALDPKELTKKLYEFVTST